MKFEIVIHNPHKSIIRYANDAWDKNDRVYDTLSRNGIDEETAIDCACWCELAGDAETYNTDEFDVYVSLQISKENH